MFELERMSYYATVRQTGGKTTRAKHVFEVKRGFYWIVENLNILKLTFKTEHVFREFKEHFLHAMRIFVGKGTLPAAKVMRNFVFH